jgi:endonuclease/exonuclease/phosphatase family metal-dependent hydrolase
MNLRLVSYNVHGFVGTDGVPDVARVAQAIREVDAHGIGLQEVPFERAADGALAPLSLLAQLPGYRAVSAPIERHDGLWHGNVFLTREPMESRSGASALLIESWQAINLSYDRREPRTALEVQLRAAGQCLRVVTTHLGLRPVERRFQVRTLLQHLAGEADVLTVLLGDFNEWFLAGRPLRWLSRYFGPSHALSTYPSWFPLFALDRVWVHPRERLVSCRVLRSTPYDRASDHLPLVAELSLANAS